MAYAAVRLLNALLFPELAVGCAPMTQLSVLLPGKPSKGVAPRLAPRLAEEVADGLTVLLAGQNVALAPQPCPRGVLPAGGTTVFDGSSPAPLAGRALLGEHLGV